MIDVVVIDVNESVGVDIQKFIIRGKNFQVNRTKIMNALKGVEPESIKKYFIKIDSKKYPIKQVISQACKIPKLGFTSLDAYHILQKLGFKIQTQCTQMNSSYQL